jgi:hypothetical protein
MENRFIGIKEVMMLVIELPEYKMQALSRTSKLDVLIT